MLNIEVNTNNSLEIIYRNAIYLFSLLVNYMNKGEKYQEYINYNFIQINLSYNLSKDIPLIDNGYFYWEEEKTKVIQSLRIVKINMDKLKQMWYDEDKKALEYKYILMLDLNSEELDKLLNLTKGDEVIMAYKKRLDKLNKDKEFTIDWDYERDIYLYENTMKAVAESKGKEEGEKSFMLKTIRNLKKMNMPIEKIAKALEVPTSKVEEILNL